MTWRANADEVDIQSRNELYFCRCQMSDDLAPRADLPAGRQLKEFVSLTAKPLKEWRE
jgi:hypothetical protein